LAFLRFKLSIFNEADMNRITLDQANRIIAVALAKGTDLKLKPLSVAVLDPGGHLIAFQRQDGASTLRLGIATGKAAGALALGVSSRKIAEMAAERPSFVAALGPMAPLGLVRRQAASLWWTPAATLSARLALPAILRIMTKSAPWRVSPQRA
jgi:uncharacterized protein GlcG (DUF336 family)